ncbi:MAG: sulfatase-like hydrolase/transferase, partial [Puniceicoccales bacterium]
MRTPPIPTRLCRLFSLGLAVTSISLYGASPDGEAPAKAPNILFAIADDWGWPHATVYGDREVETPTFDRIADKGVLFNHAYVSSPSCTPSRNAILTGQQFFRLESG